MFSFRHIATFVSADPDLETGVTDLGIRWAGGTPLLYAASQVAGKMAEFSIGSTGLTEIASQSWISQLGVGQTPTVDFLSVGTATYAVTAGLTGPGLDAFGLSAAGKLLAGTLFNPDTSAPGDIGPMTSWDNNGSTMVYAATTGSAGISTYEFAPDLALHYLGNTLTAAERAALPPSPVSDVTQLTTLDVGGKALLLATNGTDNTLSSYRIGADGLPTLAGQLGPDQGLSVAHPDHVVTTMVGGESYAVVGAFGSSSLSVVSVAPDGTLATTDHVIDGLDTRFQNATALATATVGDWSYVIAGGSDDGLSLFTLLPGGRLLHRASIADTADTALANVTTLAATNLNGQIQVIAASESEVGLSQFVIDPGPLGRVIAGGAGDEQVTGTSLDDLLSGGAGNDSLFGGAGDDILSDGTGVDVMTGGAGADTFVFTADGQPDTVLDFDPAQDQLNLSGFLMFYGASQLAVRSTIDGAVVQFGNETIDIHTAGGTMLTQADFAKMNLTDASHLLIPPTPAAPPANQPTEGNDILTGGDGNDTLSGAGGDDILRGGLGADLLDGGAGNDLAGYSQAAAGVYADLQKPQTNSGEATGDTYISIEGLSGSNFGDRLRGDNAANVIYGNDGHDRCFGRDGNDALFGGAGDDVLDTGAGSDKAFGGLGNDSLLGGAGSDSLDGGDGADTLDGGDGRDTLFGGLGNDLLSGGTWKDVLNGDAGNDTLSGGGADDTLYGNDGHDVLYGENGRDLLDGGAGNDILDAGWWSDTLFGGTGDDQLLGIQGNDSLYGGAGNDTLWGGDGHDLVIGDDGNDVLSGESGRDRIEGGAGSDALYGGTWSDLLFGGDGADQMFGGVGDDGLSGGLGNDVLWGEDGRDNLLGGGGNDTIYGGTWADTLVGGFGDDVLDGGAANDVLTGGGGSDTFVFNGGHDHITDFDPAADTLSLDLSLWNGVQPDAAALANMMSVVDGNTVITIDSASSITLDHLTDPAAITVLFESH